MKNYTKKQLLDIIKRQNEIIKKLQPTNEYLRLKQLNKNIQKGKYFSKSINNSLENFARLSGIGSFKKHLTPPLPRLKVNLPFDLQLKNRLNIISILNKFNESYMTNQINLIKARILDKLERYINEELSSSELRMNLEYLENYKEQLIKGNRFQKNPQIQELTAWTIEQYDNAILKIKDILSL